MLELDTPLALLLLPLPLLMLWLAPEYRDRSDAVRTPFFRRLVSLTGRNPTTGAVVVRKTAFQWTSVLLIWCLVVLALANPKWAEEPISKSTAARDLLLLVDLSGSMETEDFTSADGVQISRLSAVKQVLDGFIARRDSDRLGLAVFGTAAYPQAPFTDDKSVIGALLAELQPRMAGPQTMIGDAIGLGIRLFEASDMQRKVVIMLTDGNDTGSRMPVARAAEIAAEGGITIHTVAMGDPATVGEEALDLAVLEEIAGLTGGRFFLALDRARLEGVYAELDQLEPSLVETTTYRPKRSLFHYPLTLALGVVGLLALVMMSRREPKARHA